MVLSVDVGDVSSDCPPSGTPAAAPARSEESVSFCEGTKVSSTCRQLQQRETIKGLIKNPLRRILLLLLLLLLLLPPPEEPPQAHPTHSPTPGLLLSRLEQALLQLPHLLLLLFLFCYFLCLTLQQILSSPFRKGKMTKKPLPLLVLCPPPAAPVNREYFDDKKNETLRSQFCLVQLES